MDIISYLCNDCDTCIFEVLTTWNHYLHEKVFNSTIHNNATQLEINTHNSLFDLFRENVYPSICIATIILSRNRRNEY